MAFTLEGAQDAKPENKPPTFHLEGANDAGSEDSSPKGIIGDIKKDVQQDYHNEVEALGKFATGQRSLPSTALQTMANVTGPIRSVATQAVKRIPGYDYVSNSINNAVTKGSRSIADVIDGPFTERVAQGVGNKVDDIAKKHPEAIENIGAFGKILATDPALDGIKLPGKGVNKAYQKIFNNNALPNLAPAPTKALPESLFVGIGGKNLNNSPKVVEAGHNIMKELIADDDINPLDIAQRLEQAKTTGLPVRAVDVMTKEMGGVQTHGKNALGTLKAIANTPGHAASMIGDMSARGYNLSKRLGSALDSAFTKKGVYEVSDDALKNIEIETPKAYKMAFEGGSIAPLEKQFENDLNNHSSAVSNAQKKINDINNKITQIEAKKKTNSNVYVDNSLISDTRKAHEELQAAQKELSNARKAHQDNLGYLRQAQADKATGVKGAVWSPRIQEMLTDDTVQNGIKKGLWIARKEALANGEKFNPSEYGITDYDASGEPIVSKVPNMRLLDAGKKGLDAIINENKNPITGKMNETGRAISMLKNSYLKEIDSINPDYSKARKTYGDQISRLEALDRGRKFMFEDKEEIERFMKDPEVSNAEKVAFKVGARRYLQELLDSDPSNPIRSIWKTSTKDKLKYLFEDDKSFDKFDKMITDYEQPMHRVNSSVTGGSHTNPLGNYQSGMGNATKIVKGIFNPVGAATDYGMEMMSKKIAKKIAPALKDRDVGAIVAKYLTTDDPQLWYDLANRINQ